MGTVGQGTSNQFELRKKNMSVEAIDIDLTDPETAKAATTIQAGFKGFAARRQRWIMIQAVTRIQAGFRSKQTRDILKQYKTSLAADFAESSDDSEEEEDSGHF